MNTKTIKLDEASDAELRAFAKLTLGMSFDAKKKTENIRAKIKEAWDKDEITIVVDEAPDMSGTPPANPNKQVSSRSSKGDPVVEITLHEQPGPGGKRAVPVGVNGTFMLIPRNKRVKIPYRYYEVLKNAVQTHYEEEDGNITEQDVPSYPFQVHSMPSQAEIDAWVERTSNQVAA